jgi:uncharacterized protein (TIGR02246 family)
MTSRPETDIEAIRRVTSDLLAAVNASDVDRVLGVWADDAVLMPPGHPSVHGGTALREYFSKLFLMTRFTFEFTSSDIDLFADVAFERLSYRVTIWQSSGQDTIEDVGKGLHVYRRQPDGRWKLVLDIWNSDRIPAARI